MSYLVPASKIDLTWRLFSIGGPKDLYRIKGQPFGKEILRETALHFRMPSHWLIADRREGKVVYARHVGMYMCYALTNNSTTQVGKIFGDRDHTTVIHACKKIARWIDEDRENVRDDIEAIKQRLVEKEAAND